MLVTNHSPFAEAAHDISAKHNHSIGTVVYSLKMASSSFKQLSDGTIEAPSKGSQDYNVSAMYPMQMRYIGNADQEWYRRRVRYADDKPTVDKQYFHGNETMLSDHGPFSKDGFQPIERHYESKSSASGMVEDLSREATDFAPFPAIRPGTPVMYIRKSRGSRAIYNRQPRM